MSAELKKMPSLGHVFSDHTPFPSHQWPYPLCEAAWRPPTEREEELCGRRKKAQNVHYLFFFNKTFFFFFWSVHCPPFFLRKHHLQRFLLDKYKLFTLS